MRRLTLAVLMVPVPVPLAPLGAQNPPAAASQTDARPAPRDTVVEVRLRDGSVLYGRVVEETPDRIVVVTVNGVRLELPREAHHRELDVHEW